MKKRKSWNLGCRMFAEFADRAKDLYDNKLGQKCLVKTYHRMKKKIDLDLDIEVNAMIDQGIMNEET